MPDWVSLCVVIILLISLVTVAGYILYSGLLTDIIVLTGSPPVKKITFAYKFKEGPYKNCRQLFKESHSIGPKLSCIGVFYDDPKKVPGPQCRYAVGSILSEGKNQADEELLKSYETSGFNVFSFPEVTHVVATSFPHRTHLSVLLGVRRVYPRLEHYIKERRLCAHPFLQIYRDGQIQFMAPLARQGDFYVPEVRQVERRLSEQEELHSDSEVSDSNSEYSSGSGVLLSDSRGTSLAASSVHSVPIQDQGDRNNRGRSSTGTSFKDLDWEQTGGQQAEREEPLHGDSNQKSLEAPTQEWWGAVGGEE
ncbi:hypothetical protein PFLUV_G00045590 [Perca fluviatilis]|uniref:Testis expressed 264, ER-phagy receptor n=1 Tax=Perca fluviatilis TaxID=8168 RepID=A0A6A5F9E6_PERFL|nr:testis-expressed protein 264 homolog [Perca fluviatilis]KAF1391776.1 hypothetical protein PFLUV_G00045590 [Perca fluviatilis]